MLYDPERHEVVKGDEWDAGVARGHIEGIVRDVMSGRDADGYWPLHPREDEPEGAAPWKSIYFGAGGVVWALEYLRDKAGIAIDGLLGWDVLLRDYLRTPDTGEVVPSWFLGESALLVMAYLRGVGAEKAAFGERLEKVLRGNNANPTWEMLWGSPGTMLGALFAFEATGEERWAQIYREGFDRLWGEWTFFEKVGADVWLQDLYGKKVFYFGAGHGFAGNAFAMLRGRGLVDAGRREELVARVVKTTKALVERDDGFSNWRAVSGADKALVQWCHGAPGFVLAVASQIPVGVDRELDVIFGEAGELIWEAGPLAKGACFCHGTDGNGMALLSLYNRDGDVRWLERARAFAMAAVEQSLVNVEEFGRRRYSLWTGDLGLAVFLQACVDGKAFMPMLDFVRY